MLLVQKLRPDAIFPSRGSSYAVGLDLYAAEDALVVPDHVTKVPTGIAVAFDETHYGRIAPRSGLAAKHGVDVLAGVIDCDYRGEIIVLLTSHAQSHVITKGDRIAQLIMERATIMPAYEVAILPPTARGENGFGSTGL